MPQRVDQPQIRSVFRRLIRLLRPQWGMILIGLVLLLLSMPAELFPAFVWMYVADDLVLHKPAWASQKLHILFSFDYRIVAPLPLLVSALGWLLGVYLFYEVLNTTSNNIMNRVAQRFIYNLRNKVYHKLQGQSLGYLQRQRTGDLMSRAIGDVDEVQSFIVNGIDVIIGEGIQWLVTVAIVLAMDWKVASASLSPLLIVYILLRIFNKRVAPIYKAARDRAGDVSNRLQENLAGVVVIKIFGRERQEAKRFEEGNKAYYDQQIRAVNARSLYFPFARAVGFLSNVFMIGVGGYSILTGGSFTLGKLIAFRAYWWRLFGPIQTLARVNDMVQRAVAAARRIFEILDAPDDLADAADAVAIQHVTGAMELQNISFSYAAEARGMSTSRDAGTAGARDMANALPHGRDARVTGDAASQSRNAGVTGDAAQHATETTTAPVVLHDVSIRIEPGQTVALCGPSGSGKSTILNLLLRFYDPQQGSVTLDGTDIRSITRESLRRHFSLVQQETFLFNDSVLDNIRYGHGDATMEQVVVAARAANAHEFISKMPNGYETRVGERGVRLSGGQKQRISIARAFLANSQILLLDEPTSSVEPDSEATIIAALDRLMTGRTTVLTSHRPSLIGQADIVYVIIDGRVVDSGHPDEVRARNTWFGRFMRSMDDSAIMAENAE